MRCLRKPRSPRPRLSFGKKTLKGCTTSGNVNHGLSQSKPVFRKKPLRECTTCGNNDDVVLIDVDSDDYEVIIIDLPESLLEKLGKQPTSKIISLDDDEEPEEEDHADGPQAGDANHTSSDSYPSTSSPVNLSKYKRTYSQKAGSRNHYGLGSGSENDSSDSDCSDCELMEDPSGELRDQWEQAFQRRKKARCDDQARAEDHPESPALYPSAPRHPEEESREKMQAADPDPFPLTPLPHYEDKTFSTFTADGFDTLDETNFNQSIGRNPRETNGEGTASDFEENYSSDDARYRYYKQFDDGCDPFCNEEHVAEKASVPSSSVMDDNRVNDGNTSSVDREQDMLHEPCLFNCQPRFEDGFGFRMPDADCEVEPNFKCNLQTDPDPDPDPDRILSVDVNAECGPSFAPTEVFPRKTSFEEQEISNLKEPSSSDPKLHDEGEKAVDDGVKGDQEHLHSSGCCDEDDPMEEEPATAPASANPVVDDENDRCPAMVPELSQDDLIIDRQKLKETDEYKRAMEEEFASRQQQLQIQAEEAQRLRKRKRAESMRLMDMERRQKQRVEEIRERQKKDMENMNLKEQLRANIRSELYKLEVTCSDMASLLRSLGLHLALNPSQHEVQAAYKKAALKFHPDRASRADLRQQVESEERFKLISRMKERFLLTT